MNYLPFLENTKAYYTLRPLHVPSICQEHNPPQYPHINPSRFSKPSVTVMCCDTPHPPGRAGHSLRSPFLVSCLYRQYHLLHCITKIGLRTFFTHQEFMCSLKTKLSFLHFLQSTMLPHFPHHTHIHSRAGITNSRELIKSH